MFGPPSGTGSPWSVAGSAVNARLGTWQVPQLCWPDADRLVSKKSALPATAAREGFAAGGTSAADSAPPPPHADSAPAASKAAMQGHERLGFIGSHSAQAQCALPVITNAIENYSHLQRGRPPH